MPAETRRLHRNVTIGLVFGSLLFVLSGLADALRAANAVIGLSDLEMVTRFLSTSRIGRLTFVKILLAIVAAVFWNLALRRSSRASVANASVAVASAASAGLLVVMSFLSHAAGKAGFVPVASDVIHLLASIVWAGGLLFFAALPWKNIRAAKIAAAAPLAALVERFSNFALAAVAVVAATGGFAAYLHVYTPLALEKTSYGQALLVKIALFVVIMLIAGINLLFIGPGLLRAKKTGHDASFQKKVAQLASYVRLEAVVLVALLLAAGTLTTLPPADTFNEVRQTDWELVLNNHIATVQMAPMGSPGEVRVDLHLTHVDGLPVPEETRMTFDFDMTSHSMGLRPLEGERIAPGHYRATPLVSMAGRWKADIRIDFPDGVTETTSFEFEAVEGARSIGQERRFDVRAVFFEFLEERAVRPLDDTGGFDVGAIIRDFVFSPDGRPINFVAGLFWFGAAIYVVVVSRRGGLPRWTTPFGMLGGAIGVYLLFTSVLVDAYPTQFVRNPIPFTAESVATGKRLYDAHCSRCHGPEGFGDGEMAPLLDPPPEDLRARHVDFHPDGELFWWFAHGIPGTDMPGTMDVMTDEERWHVVNFVRSLHRDVPEQSR